MSTIDIFDIASIYSGSSNGWYQQNTTGSAPDPRVDFCVVAISAPDNSSHQLYVRFRDESANSVLMLKVISMVVKIRIPYLMISMSSLFPNLNGLGWAKSCCCTSKKLMS